MKIRSKRSLIVLICIGSCLVIGALIAWYTFWRPAKNTPDTQVQSTSETSESVEEPGTSTSIKLPGAEPIAAPEGDYTQDDSLWRLVNKSHPLSDIDYRPKLIKPNVATRSDKSLDEQSVREDIAPAVEELFADAKTAGHELEIGSGFRSAELQNTYYSNYVSVYGQEAADAVSAKPGYSEHQTGLAIDISTVDRNCYLEDCFGETPAGIWLRDNAHQYGFILRYPLNKEGITDFRYESWHFRYVGKDLANALYQSGLSLDEAAPYLEQR